jgi:alkanesulfonate monooxygenase
MIRLYGTCPPFSALQANDYLRYVAENSKLSEHHGLDGMLIYTDNRVVDPWIVAQAMLGNTERLLPLVAIQPVYMHPYAVAKKVATFANLLGRRIALNFVAGGFVKDLAQLGDSTPHDERYSRLEEYVRIINSLLRNEVTTSSGTYYSVSGAVVSPQMPIHLLPELFMSGSSDAGAATAKSIGATPVVYPPPPSELGMVAPGKLRAMRLGILARADRNTAWTEALAKFPADPHGQMLHKTYAATTDSVWHKQISQMPGQPSGRAGGSYWLEPMRNYKTFCPYFVGSYDDVAADLKRYVALGIDTFILDVLREADFAHVQEVFERVSMAPNGDN